MARTYGETRLPDPARVVVLIATLLAITLCGSRTSAEEPGRDVGPARTSASNVAARPAAKDCLEERELAIDPATQPLHLGTQSYAQTLDLREREIVLTFDDGPSPATTPRVLQALEQACVHATFFLIGREAKGFPRLAKAEHDAGHTVAHHSNTHPHFTLRGFDTASGALDIENGFAADDAATYGAATKDPRVPFFRFPGFADTPALLAYLDERKVAVFGSDLWAADWLMMTPDFERQRLMSALERRPKRNGIILLHDTRRSTAAMLPDLLHDLKAGGYRVAHIVYRPGAPTPALTAPRAGTPETVRILERLHPPIVENAHHLDPAPATAGDLGSTRP